jgi:AraC family transcriptional regulator
METGRQELYGHILRTLDLPHFHVTETKYDGSTYLPAHKHSHGYLSLVLQGAYQEVHHRRTVDCLSGTVIFHPAEEVHENIFPSSETSCLNLHLSFRESSLNLDLQKRIDHRRGLAVDLFKRIYRELCNPDPLSFLIMDGLGLALLGEVLRLGMKGTTVPGWLKQVEERIHSSFQEKLTMASLAASAGVHPVHLSRSFQKHYHCTIGEYLRKLRVDFTARTLCTTKIEVAEIALQTGFSDQSAFTKTFKRSTGYTPAQFRKRFRSC